MANHPGNSKERILLKKRHFLEMFADIGVITQSAASIGYDRNVILRWRQEDPEFNESFLRAIESFNDKLRKRVYDWATGSLADTKDNALMTIFAAKSRMQEFKDTAQIRIESPVLEKALSEIARRYDEEKQKT